MAASDVWHGNAMGTCRTAAIAVPSYWYRHAFTRVWTPKMANPKIAAKRSALRDALWPDAQGATWSRKENDGFTSIPRLLPLVMVLIGKLSTKGDASRV